MAQSSKQRAEAEVLDLKIKLRQLNKAVAEKGVSLEENAPLVATIKAVEGLKAQAMVMTIFKSQQFFGYVDAELPPMRISDGYKSADLSYCFAQNKALKKLPNVENIDMAVNVTSYASACGSLIEASLGALTNATEISSAFSDCPSLTSAAIGAAPKVTNASYLFSGCRNLKDVSIDLSGGLLTNFAYAFNSCTKLQRVAGIIDLSSDISSSWAFQGCTSLEEVRIKGLKVSLDLAASYRLSMDSVRYLVENAQTVKNQSIYLSRNLLEAHEEELGALGDTASDKGWTFSYR